MNFCFPRSKIFLTSIPKTGCSSAISFFTHLELWLEEKDKFIDEVDSKESIKLKYPKEFWAIHSPESNAKFYSTESVFQENSPLRIATYRNPYDRFASFWFDKVILLQDSSYHRFAIEILDQIEDLDMKLIRDAAKKFLVKSDSNSASLDHHFMPQYQFFDAEQNYEIYVETQELSTLPKKIAQFSPDHKNFERLIFPKFHSTNLPDVKDFYDDELKTLVNKFYEKDFKFISEIGGGEQNVVISKKKVDSLKSRKLIEFKRSLRSVAYLIVERDNLIVERDNLIVERDNLIVERDNLIKLSNDDSKLQSGGDT
jgi:hypothetical protein